MAFSLAHIERNARHVEDSLHLQAVAQTPHRAGGHQFALLGINGLGTRLDIGRTIVGGRFLGRQLEPAREHLIAKNLLGVVGERGWPPSEFQELLVGQFAVVLREPRPTLRYAFAQN